MNYLRVNELILSRPNDLQHHTYLRNQKLFQFQFVRVKYFWLIQQDCPKGRLPQLTM